MEKLMKLEHTEIDLENYIPEREGYTFEGWYLDHDFDQAVDSVTLRNDITLYAKWDKMAEEAAETEPTENTQDQKHSSFADVAETDWFYDAVYGAVENGLMSSMSETIFAPNMPMNREMMAVVLYQMEGQPESTSLNPFTDVEANQWYTDAILWANDTGIAMGYGTGKYGVGDAITREQFAAILYRYAKYKGYDVSIGEDTNLLSFADVFTISDYAYPAMQWACDTDIINGMGDGTMGPQGLATRAEAAAMLMNFCERAAQ